MERAEVDSTLFTEYERIGEVLDVLENAAARLERGEDVNPMLFVAAANYLDAVTNGCHREREEQYLFPKLQEHGVGVEGGPIGTMRKQRRLAEDLVRTLHDEGLKYASGALQDARPLADVARGYVALMRRHILPEDRALLRMAGDLLGPEEYGGLMQACAQVGQEVLARQDGREPFQALMEELEKASGT